MKGDFHGEVLRVDPLDANWVIHVEVIRLLGGERDLPLDRQVHFLVHSPSEFLGPLAYESGRQYKFVVVSERDGNNGITRRHVDVTDVE
jgi:hypothetical protein